MRYCPTCAARYDDQSDVCPEDGTELEPFDGFLGAVVDGKFRIDAFLGAGAMGAVYEATQLSLGRTVALKIIRQDTPVSRSGLERFKREALAVARLKHPNIVTIYDTGVAPGFGAYTVMEHLRGRTLHDELKVLRRLPPERAVEIMRQICSAVHAAHEVGVIHRDLKPHNIFLEDARGGQVVKVLDFGIAKLGDSATGKSPGLTRSGALLGTPLYMSPEQCSDLPVDARSDVYALGCVLFEMLTGKPPFSAASVAAILVKQLAEQARPPSSIAPSVPRALDDVVLKALAKAPEERYQSARELEDALASSREADLLATTDSPKPVLEGTVAEEQPSEVTRESLDRSRASGDSLSAFRTTPNNLPGTTASFTEQVRVVGELRDLLETARAVTLTGPAGPAKTQLAGQLASEVLSEFPDGVWFVEVAPLTTEAQIPRAVAAVLGVPGGARAADVGTIAEYLRGKRVLLVFDHCDHLAPSCAAFIAELLAVAPGLRVIATAGRPLGIGGESVYRLGSLTGSLDQTASGHHTSPLTGSLAAQAASRRWLLPALLAAVALAIGVAAYAWLSRPSATIDSVAILPFVVAGGDQDVEYLSDGIVESVINELSRLPELRVLARTTVFRYKGQAVDPVAAGRELGVRAVLTGRVTKRGDAVTIQVELVDTANGTQLWGEHYARRTGDLQSVQIDISSQITKRLRGRLSGDAERMLARHATDNGEAYELYLQGRYHLAKQTLDSWRKAVAAFERAIELDRRYALAHAGLADAYVQASNIHLPPAKAMPLARDSATRALDLDPDLAEAHVALGQVRLWYEWDWAGAERELRRAVELNRGYAFAHYQHAYALLVIGRFEEAEADMREAQRLDPLSLPVNRDLGSVYFFARQFDRAVEQYRDALELDPSFKSAHVSLATAYAEMGRYADALAELDASGDAPGATRRLSVQAYILARSGDADGARSTLAELQAIEADTYVSPVGIARVYAALGARDDAFAYLEKAYAARADSLVWLKVDPRFDALRGDPRFDDLLRRIGL